GFDGAFGVARGGRRSDSRTPSPAAPSSRSRSRISAKLVSADVETSALRPRDTVPIGGRRQRGTTHVDRGRPRAEVQVERACVYEVAGTTGKFDVVIDGVVGAR